MVVIVIMIMRWLIFFLLYAAIEAEEENRKHPRIGIVGGGVGGTSASYFLREYFSEAHIDLYEPNSVLGGRVAVTELGGRYYEAGGTIIHDKNLYMKNFVDLLGLHHREKTEDGVMGLFDGDKYTFVSSSWEIVDTLKAFYHYGWSPLRMRSMVNEFLPKFMNIYTCQENGVAYDEVSELLRAMDEALLNATKRSTNDIFLRRDMSEKFINEFVGSINRVNYGQRPDMQAFAGITGVVGAMFDLWAVHGGNYQVTEGLANLAKANHVQSQVTEIKRNIDGTFTLKFSASEDESRLTKEGGLPNHSVKSEEDSSDSDICHNDHYDIVIIAVPLVAGKSDIKLVNINTTGIVDSPYHRTVATLIQGTYNQSYLGEKTEGYVLDEIFLFNPKNKISAIARNYPTDYSPKEGKVINPEVWKVFSSSPLTNEELEQMFPGHGEFRVYDWLAYPHYSSTQKQGRFNLGDGLFYTSDMEWASSAMETVCIAAKNVALLSKYYWNGEESPTSCNHKSKEEL